MFTAHIKITLRPSILDPKGKAAGEALSHLGYSAITNVRIGKFIRLNVDAATREEGLKDGLMKVFKVIEDRLVATEKALTEAINEIR